jgi:peptidyl-dipeptidase Dcp
MGCFEREYPSFPAPDVPRDFVEFPSQFNEHWASYPAVFDHFAKHYKTGEPMPAELAAKIRKAESSTRDILLTELLAAAELDMQWHTLSGDGAGGEARCIREGGAGAQAHCAGHGAAALPLELLPAYLGWRLRGGLLRVPVERDAGRRRVPVVRRPRRPHDARQRRSLPQDGAVAGNTEDLAKMYAAWLGAEPSTGNRC